jgi:threonine aldolase
VLRLREDHDNARRLARGLAELGLEVDGPPESNIVLFGVPRRAFGSMADAATFSRAAREHDLLVNPVDRLRLRAVTHLDVSGDGIQDALARMRVFLR